jgi:rsbT antagonist protein RsbS
VTHPPSGDARVPIIRLWDFLLIPVQGDMSDHVAERMCEDVLGELEHRGARALLLDIAAARMMDSHLCAVVAHLARAARFMGCDTVVSGISAEIAMTLEAMGLDLAAGRTVRSIEDALLLYGVQGTHPDEERRRDEGLVATALELAQASRTNTAHPDERTHLEEDRDP